MVVTGYLRVSCLAQIADGNGLDTQEARIRAWCAYQGLPEPVFESDPGMSGMNGERPGFHRAIKSVIDGGPGSVLVVYRLDRLGRDAVSIQEIIDALMHAGVRIVSITEGLDSGGEIGGMILKLLVAVLSSVAELERATILERMRDGRAQAKAAGRVYTRHAPYGYAKDGAGNLLVNPAEQATVTLMRTLRAGGHSFRDIAAFLMAEGIRPRNGATWDPSAIRQLTVGRSKAKPRVDERRQRVLSKYAQPVARTAA